MTLTPGGSIDDALANFIATHEQTSISKAANALRDFSVAARAELAAGKEVEIPGIGHFTETNGLIQFVSSPQVRHMPPPVPVIRMAKRTEEQPDFRRDMPEEKSGSEVAWGKVALLGLLAVLIIAGGIFAYRYFSSQPASGPVAQDTVRLQAVPQPPVATMPADTASRPAETAPATPPAQGGAYTVVLNSYSSRAAAERRQSFLARNGNEVELLAKDSTQFLVIIRMPQSTADTTRMLDSLRRFFNPKGVYILR